MRRILFFSLGGFLLVVLLPYLIVHFGAKESGERIKVYVTEEDAVREMDTEQYLKEVVAAEMPVEFNKEALKAQAVAARTYLKSRENKHFDEHKGAVVCTDYKHCKAWISEEKRKELWEAEKREQYWKKISDCVNETKNQYIMYNGAAIDALFHSTSSGYTENASDVWGGEVPYLVSVKSDGEELSPRYKSEKTVTVQEFKDKISEKVENTDWAGDLFSDIERSEAGGIKTMKAGGVEISGVTLRTIFELRSTNVQLEEKDGNVHFDVKGNGHGVGMSQYGANYLASTGMGYKDILKHYYTGTEIVG